MEQQFKFSSGDELFYVNPHVFVIDLVRVDFAYREDDGTAFYIDQTGAYLREWELFRTLEEAKNDAVNKLNKFYSDKLREIINKKPTYDNGDLWK